jgi:hypothetical protein
MAFFTDALHMSAERHHSAAEYRSLLVELASRAIT